MEYCLYCDEICHIENDAINVMDCFCSELSHEVRKKQKEYEAWRKAVEYRDYTPDELIREIMERLP